MLIIGTNAQPRRIQTSEQQVTSQCVFLISMRSPGFGMGARSGVHLRRLPEPRGICHGWRNNPFIWGNSSWWPICKSKIGTWRRRLALCQNQHLRWILIDEALMIPDELLGQYAANFESAARDTRYRRRADSSPRIFGGYNVLLFGDMNQLPPKYHPRQLSSFPRSVRRAKQQDIC